MLRPKLLDSLKGYSRKKLFQDIFAGIVVGIVSIPLAIAFAIASGATPQQGLITAIIAGFIISAFGGSRVQIGGPTGAFVVIIYSVIQNYGMNGLLIATILAGIFLIILGLLRAGTLIKFIPYSVIVGFTAGIALIIFTSQINDALGLGIKNLPSEFIEKIHVLIINLPNVSYFSLGIALATIIIMRLWPKNYKVPGSIFAIMVFSILVYFYKLPVETIGSRFGDMSMSFPVPSLPFIDFSIIQKLLRPAFSIAILAAIESLMSAIVADGMIGGKHRPNMELVAQGFANVFSPFFGGIPATGAIARTAINIKNGGRTPVAGIANSIVLLIVMLFLGNFVKSIPMACLAGILMVVAFNMSEWRSFKSLLSVSKSGSAIVLTTFFLTVLTDLTFAIEIGLVLASILFIGKMTAYTSVTKMDISDDEHENAEDLQDELNKLSIEKLPEGILVYEVNGPLFFGAAYKFKEEMETIQESVDTVVIRMRNVPMIDSSGMQFFRDVYKSFKKNKIKLILSELQPQVHERLEKSGLEKEIGKNNILAKFDQSIQKAISEINTQI